MTAPFKARISVADEECLSSVREITDRERQVAAMTVDDHLVIVAAGPAAKELIRALTIDDESSESERP